MLRSIPKVDEVLAQPQVKKAMEEGRGQVTDGCARCWTVCGSRSSGARSRI